MGATKPRSGFVLRLGAALLAGLVVVQAVPVGAADEDDESAVGMNALEGLMGDGGGGDLDRSPSGDLDDPLAGGSGGPPSESGTEETGAEAGTTEGSDPADSATASANPMFKLMLELILEDVRATEAKAEAAGKTLTDAQRSAVAAQSVKDLVTFLQETGLLGDVDTREILQQIEAIPAGSEE
jgi:hypothetical protein